MRTSMVRIVVWCRGKPYIGIDSTCNIIIATISTNISGFNSNNNNNTHNHNHYNNGDTGI